jgi:error-prone DNA polymerase
MSHAFTHRRAHERMLQLENRMRASMKETGVAPEAIEQIVAGIRAFAEYGFPESHAASFALLVYASLYLKVHHPAVFLVALLNNQPMGFYPAATLIKDAQRHGVRMATPCVVRSAVKATALGPQEVRLGLESVRNLGEAWAKAIVEARTMRPFASVADVVMRAHLDRNRSEALAQAGAFSELGSTRRAALWDVHGALGAGGLAPPPQASRSPLPELSPAGRTIADYSATGVTVGPQLMALLRPRLNAERVTTAAALPGLRHGSWVRTAGLVIARQRPGTAKGMVFLSLEDETGISNAVIDPTIYEAYRTAVLTSAILLLEGSLQSIDGVVTVKARRIRPVRSPSEALPSSRDFH